MKTVFRSRPLAISLALHAIVIGLIIGVSISGKWREPVPAPEYIFELVSAPDAPNDRAPVETAGGIAPQAEPVAPVPVPTSAAEPQALLRPTPAAAPAPKPAAPRDTLAESLKITNATNADLAAMQKSPLADLPGGIVITSNTITHLPPADMPDPTKTLVRGVSVVKSTAAAPSDTPLNIAAHSSANLAATSEHSDDSVTDAYFTTFIQSVRDVYHKPIEALVPPSPLKVRVQYRVAADGTIGPVEIVRTSGSDAFDQSVVAAILSIHNIGPRPDGRSSMKIADFCLTD